MLWSSSVILVLFFLLLAGGRSHNHARMSIFHAHDALFLTSMMPEEPKLITLILRSTHWLVPIIARTPGFLTDAANLLDAKYA